jgi:hypothetical protein
MEARRTATPLVGQDDAFAELLPGRRGLLALVVRTTAKPDETTFLTDPEANMQVGFVVYPTGGTIARHAHRPPPRRIESTTEALFIRSGRCTAEIYDEDGELAHEVDLAQGDVIVLFAGGHGFRMAEDTVMLEIKQGPYVGVVEKVRF